MMGQGPGFRALRRGLLMAALAIAPAAAQVVPEVPPALKDARDALWAAKDKDPKQARDLIAKLSDPLHKKSVQWVLFQQKDHGAGFAEIAAFIVSAKGWPRLADIQERAEAAVKADDDKKTVVEFFQANRPRGFAGWRVYLAALAALDRKDELAAAIKQAWAQSPMSANEEDSFLATLGAGLAAEDHKARLTGLLRQRKTNAAVRLLPRLKLPAEDAAYFEAWIGLQASDNGALARAPADRRDSADLLFEAVRNHRLGKRYTEAAELLARAPKDEAAPNRWFMETNRVVRELLAAGKAEPAYRAAAGHKLTQGEGFATLEFLAGWIALSKMKEPKRALPHFERLYNDTRAAITRGRGAFWAARAAEAAGEKETAEKWRALAAGFPLVFYGQLALHQGGKRALELPAETEADAAATAALAADETARAGAFFAALNEDEFARLFLLRLAESADKPERFAALAAFATSINRIDAAVRAARRGTRDGAVVVKLGYPKAPLPDNAKIEAAYVNSIIRQESEFWQAAVSPAGALGLMQLMPATAQDTARRLKLAYDKGRLTADAAYNILLGARFLDDVTRRFNGSYALAAAAYNAGPRRVDEWIKQFGDPRSGTIDPLDWIESIPFEETRNYVMRVLENLAIYRTLDGKPAFGDKLWDSWRPPEPK